MPRLARSALAGVVILGALTLGACSTTVTMTPAKNANDPLCAEVTVRLPAAIGEHERVWTDAQATGAWGDGAIALTCGLDAPPPTAELQCRTLGGVDWLVDPEDFPWMRMISYGHQPAVQVYVDTEKVSANEALTTLGPIVTNIPATSACIAPEGLPD